MIRVLITGANGFVGSALVAQLARLPGYRPVAATRRSDVLLPATADMFHVTAFHDQDHWRTAMSGIDVVVHSAARVPLPNNTSIDPMIEYRRDNVEASRAVAQAAADAGVRRFVFVSSMGVNGRETMDERFNETMQPHAETPYAQSKLEAEIALKEIAGRTDMVLVIVRPPLVYGNGVAGNFERLLRLVARGVPMPFALVKNQRSGIALDNLVDFLTLCLHHPKAANELFVVSDAEAMSTPELISTLAHGMKRPARLIPVPVALMRLGAKLTGRTDMFRQLCGSMVVDIGKARRLLDWTPPLNAEVALTATAAAYVNQPHGQNGIH